MNDDDLDVPGVPLLPQENIVGAIAVVVLLLCGWALRSWLYAPAETIPPVVPVVAPADSTDAGSLAVAEALEARLMAAQAETASLTTRVTAIEARVAALETRAEAATAGPKAQDLDAFQGEKEPERRQPLTKRERVKAIVFTTPNCVPCEKLKTEWRAILPPLGWKLDGDGADIEFRAVSSPETGKRYPYTEIHVDGKRVLEIVGYCTAQFITETLLRHINSLDTEA